MTLNHVLAGCPWVRDQENRLSTEDRFTWRHNCVLFHLAASIAEFVTKINTLPVSDAPTRRMRISFVQAGSKKSTTRKSQSRFGLLHRARDWIFDFDLPEWGDRGSYVFPHDIATTALNPDGFLISRQTKTCVILELTAPLEENISTWNIKKTDKYKTEIASICEPEVLAIEVGAKGWIPSSFFRAFKKLGFPPSQTRKIADSCQLLARKCSYLIWINV